MYHRIRWGGGHALNSAEYWNHRFKQNWDERGGRLQTTLFAASFALAPGIVFNPAPESVLDYGCGLGDSLPVLSMRFPLATLAYYDLSDEAMHQVAERYGVIATALDREAKHKFQLVYCSNVIEHIANPMELIRELESLSCKWIVVQAPLDERHEDGSPLSVGRPKGEHVHTISRGWMRDLGAEGWAEYEIPGGGWAGSQIVFIKESAS